MEMINDLFRIIRLDTKDHVCGVVSFNKDHVIFKSHFPKNPIVPGVCILYIVKLILEKIIDKKLVLTQASNIKFKNVITPLYAPSFNFSKIQVEGNLVHVKVNVVYGKIDLVKMTLVYSFRSND